MNKIKFHHIRIKIDKIRLYRNNRNIKWNWNWNWKREWFDMLTCIKSPCESPGAVKFRWHTNGNAFGLSISISYVFPMSPNHVRLHTVFRIRIKDICIEFNHPQKSAKRKKRRRKKHKNREKLRWNKIKWICIRVHITSVYIQIRWKILLHWVVVFMSLF